eukprot:49592-Rhodomonas_salina.1
MRADLEEFLAELLVGELFDHVERRHCVPPERVPCSRTRTRSQAASTSPSLACRGCVCGVCVSVCVCVCVCASHSPQPGCTGSVARRGRAVSYTHLRAHETEADL